MSQGISAKAVQHGLERQGTGALQTLWLETPGRCNLACSYCYANGGTCDEKRLLSWENYVKILEEFKALGGDSLGIPGAGEPLLPGKNQRLTMRILRKAKELGLFVTLFTTGQFITEELAKELYELPVELMLKGNSLDEEKQDAFVSDPARGQIRKGYGKARNRCIRLLKKLGFVNKAKCMAKFGRRSRMALVTSIMKPGTGEGPSNYDEVADILRFCRRHNIIFDCDTVLERGRGATCDLRTAGVHIKTKLEELQRIDRAEFPKYPRWEISQSYVGTVCDRYRHHLYINQYGEIRPCIGAMDVNLGNAKTTSLENTWNSSEMRIIRNRCYRGVCGTNCQNFAEGKCNSCLGRRAVNLTNEFLRTHGFVDTIGCWNNRPISDVPCGSEGRHPSDPTASR